MASDLHPQMDLDEVKESLMSPHLESVRLVSGRKVKDREIRAELDESGYSEFPAETANEVGASVRRACA